VWEPSVQDDAAYTRKVSVNTTDPMIGRLIDGRYQVRSRIARGGMATVYLATDLRLERRVAVKVMHSHLADDSQFKQRFIQEARSAARLAHPNVVNVFDQGQDADSAYLVMEYLPGITLRDLLVEYGSLTSQQTIDITEAVLSGLAAAHKAGIVHRDLKPENVLLADDGRIKIGDFGLARAASANTATGAALLGTIAYLSPELVTRGVADTRSDIYAVGIMMFEMLTGEQPFKGEQPMQIAYQHANDTVPAPSGKNSKVPAELDELVMWATARDPEQRPRDARAMLDQLHETESLLRTALPTGSTAAQRTMVLPAATERFAAPARQVNDETQIIAARTPSKAAAVSDSTAALTKVSQKRRGRGVALFLVILLLVAGAGVAGWWFGAGPGSRVTIPNSISGMSPADATTALTKLGLKVNPTNGTVASTTTAANAVAETDPPLGSQVIKGGAVTLLVSSGPKPIAFTITQGMPVPAAEAIVKAAPWTEKPQVTQFDPKVPIDTVISVLAADGTTNLIGAPSYGQKQPLTLIVSAGAVPDVAGKTFAEASAALAAVKLNAASGDHAYSDTVPAGDVLAAEIPAGTVVKPNDVVKLQISDGQAPVAVPNVVGLYWSQAKPMLDAAGLKYSYDHAADGPQASLIQVKSTNPTAGVMVHRGDTIAVRFTN
jgi:beta-lactam-binding protein with PASTA domain/tRNA A-37 threonylcarbamoyl transferase component Bud32